jgi:hypothetical protein
MSDVLYWTMMALYCGLVLVCGWLFAGVPHGTLEITFCVTCHIFFLAFAVKAMSIRWEKEE